MRHALVALLLFGVPANAQVVDVDKPLAEAVQEPGNREVPAPPTAAVQALDVLERQTLPFRGPAGLVNLPVETLTKAGWSDSEAATIASASSSTWARIAGVAVAGALLAGVGTTLGTVFDPPTSAWLGLTSSLVTFAAMTLGLMWATAPILDLFALFETRDRRVRKDAISASDWDPTVVHATSQLIGIGQRQGTNGFVRNDQLVSDEELTRISPAPAEYARARTGAITALVLMVVGGLALCAPPAILGATTLPRVGDIAISVGTAGLGLAALLIARPLANAAAEREEAMINQINAAVIDQARKSLAPRPAPPGAAGPAPPTFLPAPEAD